jgi:hypothetical protein
MAKALTEENNNGKRHGRIGEPLASSLLRRGFGFYSRLALKSWLVRCLSSGVLVASLAACSATQTDALRVEPEERTSDRGVPAGDTIRSIGNEATPATGTESSAEGDAGTAVVVATPSPIPASDAMDPGSAVSLEPVTELPPPPNAAQAELQAKSPLASDPSTAFSTNDASPERPTISEVQPSEEPRVVMSSVVPGHDAVVVKNAESPDRSIHSFVATMSSESHRDEIVGWSVVAFGTIVLLLFLLASQRAGCFYDNYRIARLERMRRRLEGRVQSAQTRLFLKRKILARGFNEQPQAAFELGAGGKAPSSEASEASCGSAGSDESSRNALDELCRGSSQGPIEARGQIIRFEAEISAYSTRIERIDARLSELRISKGDAPFLARRFLLWLRRSS